MARVAKKENISADFLQTIAEGFKRQSIACCSRWATQYRVMGMPNPGPVRYNKHPWTRAIRDCTSSWVGPKAAQMGYTESALDTVFYKMDVHKIDVLYLLPKKVPDASEFSAARFGGAIALSPHLNRMFSDVSNVGHKKAGATNLYIRGTMSKSAVKSVSVGLIVFDEYDEMNMANLPQAEERLSGYKDKQTISISTPTVPNYGIDEQYLLSTQEHYMFKCPSCGKRTELLFPESLVICTDDASDAEGLARTHLICPLCKNVLPHETKEQWLSDANAEWVPSVFSRSIVRGFHINQLYSCTVTPGEIAKKVILARYNPAIEQEVMNSKAGRPHVVAGARVTVDVLQKCIGTHSRRDTPPLGRSLITMGVDQGKQIHYHIDQWFIEGRGMHDINSHALAKTLAYGSLLNFEDLDHLMREYQVLTCVLDANPETRKAFEFATRFNGHVYLCYYSVGIAGKRITIDEDGSRVSVDRTSWLDLTMGRYKSNRISLPREIGSDKEYQNHIMSLIRKPELDRNGNPVYKYLNVGADHFAHARNYSEIALPLAVSRASNTNVNNLV